MEEKKEDKMERRKKYWGGESVFHKDPCYGRVVSLYIFRKRKWVKVGEYCTRCGNVHLFVDYKEGIEEEKRSY